MLQLLVESRPARARAGSATLFSLLVHGAVITTAVLATRSVLPSPVLPSAPLPRLIYVPPATPATPAPPRVAPAAPAEPAPSPAPAAPATPTVQAPVEVPVGLPPVAPARTTPGEPVIGAPVVPATGTEPGTGAPTTAPDGGAMWAGEVERAAAPVGRQRAPEYPEVLRLQRVEGAVTVQFVVDERGRVEEGSLRVLESAHALFEPAVRRAVLATRFRPAQFRGRAVRQLVQQQFVFTLTR